MTSPYYHDNIKVLILSSIYVILNSRNKYYYLEVCDLFEIGDKIVYPMQGTGIIKDIEERNYLGENQVYYIIKMLTGNMKIMISLDRMSDSSVRLINNSSALEDILLIFDKKVPTLDESLTSKQRQKINLDKIKSGTLQEIAEVVHDLTYLDKIKPLNLSEKDILSTAQRFLIDEISLIKDISVDEAEKLLMTCLY